MQTLLLAQRLMPRVIEGRKRATLRHKHRRVRLGPLRFRSTKGYGDYVVVNVSEVRHKSIQEVTEEEALLDGHANLQSCLAAFFEWYPRAREDAKVTVVIWSGLL